MSNDVHLARVSKIQRSSDVTKSGGGGEALLNLASQRRCVSGRSYGGGGGGSMKEQLERSCDTDADFQLESPDHTQRDTNESDNNISSCSTLDIVNKVENLSVNELEMQVRELSQRLQQAEQRRVEMQQQLEECNAEKELSFRRLEVISSAHECRITEMHCVIAELSKKLRAKQDNTILEEQEPEVEGSEISYQEGSVYNSEMNLTNPDMTDNYNGDCGDSVHGESVTAALGMVSECERMGGGGRDGISDEDNMKLNDMGGGNKCQVEALQEEVLHLKAQIALLQSEIANSLHCNAQDDTNGGDKVAYGVGGGGAGDEEDDLDGDASNCSIEQNCDDEKELNDLNAFSQADFLAPLKPITDTVSSPQKEPPVAKMAERVKLRCASKPAYQQDSVTATHLLNNEIKNADIVEHLVADMKRDSSSMMASFVDPLQVDNEMQRLQRKVEHLKVENRVLSLTLAECKEHCEHLYLLCGKYESNAIALQSAVNCSDRAIEAYDVMLALLESKMALIKDKSSTSAEENRKAVESVARHLLDRLESEKNVCENSLGPWQNSFSIPDKVQVSVPWRSEDDNRLRCHVSKLKGRRATVQNTIVQLESPFSDFYEKSRMAIEGRNLPNQEKPLGHVDLEIAVLMQELLNLREENIAFKAKAEEAERERQFAMDRINLLQEALKQLQFSASSSASTSLAESAAAPKSTEQSALFYGNRGGGGGGENRLSYSEAEHVALTEQQLVEALTRESELKLRLQTLIASVSASQKVSDEKYEQLHNSVRDLQKSNLSLAQLLEQNKRKYQSRIRRLEQKIVEMELSRQTTSGGSSSASGQVPCTMGSEAVVRMARQNRSRNGVGGGSMSALTTPVNPLYQDNVPETTL